MIQLHCTQVARPKRPTGEVDRHSNFRNQKSNLPSKRSMLRSARPSPRQMTGDNSTVTMFKLRGQYGCNVLLEG
jgi:hypothetical protein